MIDTTINSDATIGGDGRTLLANRYLIVKQLGQGGMGSVWLAHDTMLDDREVAIKMLPSVLLSNKRAYQQIKSEALLSLKLLHSNIAPIRSFEENGGNPFLVEDYIRGKNLDDCLAEWGTLSDEETVSLLMPIAEAIDYAHHENVVHRDIKPANIQIREDGHPYVLDFGIAREMQETMTRVTGKLSSGTLMYMSPEQLKGAAPNPLQDVYSFAAMAYECLCGHPPFHRGQIEYQIMNEAPDPLPRMTALGRSVMAGLDKDASKRPSTCKTVLAGIVTGTNEMPKSHGGQDDARTAIPTVSPRRHPVALIVGVLACVGVVGIVAMLMMRSGNPSDRAALATEAATGRNTAPAPLRSSIVVHDPTPLAAANEVPVRPVEADSSSPVAGKSEDGVRENVALSVNGRKLTQKQIDEDVQRILEAQGDKVPQDQKDYATKSIRNQIAQSFIVEAVLVAKARREGYIVTDADRKVREAEFLKATAKMADPPKSLEDYFSKFPLGEERARTEFENGILIDKMIRASQQRKPDSAFEERAREVIAAAVSSNKVLSASLTDAEAKIKKLRRMIVGVPASERSEKFAEVAKNYSACPSSQKGGDLGLFSRGQMVAEFDRVAFSLPVGVVSEPVLTQFGYHLILVDKKVGDQISARHILVKTGKKCDVPTLASAIESLRKADERQFVQEFVRSEIKNADIQVSDEYKQLLPQR